ncbi:MAG: hypothetical protein IKF37_02425 [Bacilli bacterium]|nr:hypothetical protein [Bacilli bacterium]
MEYSKLYEELINKAHTLFVEKSEEELYDLGKLLPFRERTSYDYKIKSLKENFEFYEPYSEYYNKKHMIETIIENDELEYILNNFEEISKYDFESKEPIFKYINDNIDRINKERLQSIKYIFVFQMLERKYELEDKDINKVKDLIETTAENENLTIFNIKKINYGSYSSIYKLGSKIIKIGCKRAINNIVDNNRILLPDKLIKVKSNIIEITDYIDGKSDFSKDEVYKIYKELREQGIVWLDPTKDNLKRLDESTLKKQEIKSLSRDRYPFIKNRKFINKPLKANDLIIIDLDHLVDERDKANIYRANDYLREDILTDRENYEKRYLLEKKKAIE